MNKYTFKSINRPDVDILTLAELYEDEFIPSKVLQDNTNWSNYQRGETPIADNYLNSSRNYTFKYEEPVSHFTTDFGNYNTIVEQHIKPPLFSSPLSSTDMENKASESLLKKAQLLIKENPVKSLLIAGTVIGGSYLLYRHLDEQNKNNSSNINGFADSVGSMRKKRKRTALGTFLSNVEEEAESNETTEQDEESSETGYITEVEKAQAEVSFMEAGLHLASFFGGGLAGTFIGKSAPLTGAGLVLYGLYKNNNYLACAGIGMVMSSFFNCALEEARYMILKPREKTAGTTQITNYPMEILSVEEPDAPAQTQNASKEEKSKSGVEQDYYSQFQQSQNSELDKTEQENNPSSDLSAINVELSNKEEKVAGITYSGEELDREL